jgi:hypothetical protein
MAYPGADLWVSMEYGYGMDGMNGIEDLLDEARDLLGGKLYRFREKRGKRCGNRPFREWCGCAGCQLSHQGKGSTDIAKPASSVRLARTHYIT